MAKAKEYKGNESLEDRVKDASDEEYGQTELQERADHFEEVGFIALGDDASGADEPVAAQEDRAAAKNARLALPNPGELDEVRGGPEPSGDAKEDEEKGGDA